MPEVDAADHLLVGVDPPQRPHLPVEPPADDLEQARLHNVVTALSVALGVASVAHQIPRQPAGAAPPLRFTLRPSPEVTLHRSGDTRVRSLLGQEDRDGARWHLAMARDGA